MPPGGCIDTPQTTTDTTFLTNGLGGFDQLSPEKSFASPSKGRDLLQAMRNGRGLSLKTPRAGGRDPLRLLPNGAAPKSEFTPLMMSVTKKNHQLKASGGRMGTRSPYSIKDESILTRATPGLPRNVDSSHLYNDRTSSFADDAADETPVPHTVDGSSFQSTPLAPLPARDGKGGIVGDGQMMTLREQENIIDKIDKENFNLKMKIHFLEDNLQKRGADFNQAALKENTDLKVSRITMQRELHKFKKNIAQAERDAEVYKSRLEEYRVRISKKKDDQNVRIETERVQDEVKAKESEIVHLQRELQLAQQGHGEVQNMRDEISDLEAEMREKDRLIEEREDEIDTLKEEGSGESNSVAMLENELESTKHQIEQLQGNLDDVSSECDLARQEREDAVTARKQAENDLQELRNEIMNKSFTTKGLSRQMEEKIADLEEELADVQGENTSLHQELDRKTDSEQQLQERLRASEEEGSAQVQFRDQLDLADKEQERLKTELGSMAAELQNAHDDLQCQSEGKDLLQIRYDRLASEAASLQRDLAKSQTSVAQLEQALDDERQHAAQNDNFLRSDHKGEVDMLTQQIDSLHRDINAKTSQHASDLELWEAQRRRLESAGERAGERASGLQRTVDKLQQVEGTLSGREMNLQKALDSEKQRHQHEEQMLSRQVQELHDEIAAKRETSDEQRAELDNAREELAISIRDQATLQEHIGQLEEEVEVLQASVDEGEDTSKRQNQGAEGLGAQLQEIQREKQKLQDQLGNTNVQLHQLKDTAQDVKKERDELEARLLSVEEAADDTFNEDHEKRELQRSKQKLEKEVERLRAERETLQEGNRALEAEVHAEIERSNVEEDRLNLELDNLRKKQLSTSDSRDRQLVSAKSKAQQLERRVGELEELLESQARNIPSPGIEDVSILRKDLADARKQEAASLQRESTLKSTSRDLKSQVARLEREVHELQMVKLNISSRCPSSSPISAKELARTRKDMLDAQATLRDLRKRNRELEHQVSKASVDEAERADLHDLVKSSSLEAEALSLKLSDRDIELLDMKVELKRLRSEREQARAQAEAASRQHDAMLERHGAMLDKSRFQQESSADQAIRQKELRGLMKEVVWLRARCRRAEGFRRDLAWSKGFMEMGEGIRAACNQADLGMLQEMGVKGPPRSTYESKLAPRQRFRAAIHVVVAANRMRSWEKQWRDLRKMGEGLQRTRDRVNGGRVGG